MTALDEIAAQARLYAPEELARLRHRGRLEEERRRLLLAPRHSLYAERENRDRIKAIDAELARLDRAAQETPDAP